MFREVKYELKALSEAIRTLSFREVIVFMSVSFITFVSMYYASPSFFRRTFDTGDDKFFSTIWWFTADGILMLVIPLFIIKFILKGKLPDYGFTLGDYRFGLKSCALFLVIMIPVLWIFSGNEAFARTYPQGGPRVRENLDVLLYYELFVGFYMLAWEFFWRGFMLFGLKPKFGYYAIFIQMIPFFILHRGKPEVETFASIFAGLLLGVQAYRANSFIYCFILHWCVMICIDILSVLRYRTSTYGIGIESLIKIFQ
jgi:hypothetical protein